MFLTWFGDCLEEPCPLPGPVDQAAYVFDVIWWLAFPVLAFFAYRSRRWAWASLLFVAIVLDLQVRRGDRRRAAGSRRSRSRCRRRRC